MRRSAHLVARLPLNEIVPELLQQGDPHPPLHYLTLGGWMRLVGESEFALRYLSALTGTLLLSVLGVLGRRMAGRKAGLLAAGLAALSPGLI
ncbi:MAG: glycosyltransferase family 39 protein [Chloroflexota bacterium]